MNGLSCQVRLQNATALTPFTCSTLKENTHTIRHSLHPAQENRPDYVSNLEWLILANDDFPQSRLLTQQHIHKSFSMRTRARAVSTVCSTRPKSLECTLLSSHLFKEERTKQYQSYGTALDLQLMGNKKDIIKTTTNRSKTLGRSKQSGTS